LRTGFPITGTEGLEKRTHVFHAATRLVDGRLLTAGGRVLSVCAEAPSLEEARKQAYRGVEAIHFEGMQFRHDIGARAARKRAPGP
jgi:phosphoribosylamine---glycine ligase